MVDQSTSSSSYSAGAAMSTVTGRRRRSVTGLHAGEELGRIWVPSSTFTS
ncbi:unnamed protein product, partial [Musa hybrid cultivar]